MNFDKSQYGMATPAELSPEAATAASASFTSLPRGFHIAKARR
ncbi:hypothetical protein FLP41_15915 [Paracoccus marcusii]|nr:hypothetical protein FLP41_15915 [Paracoccus marcusii]